VVKHTKKSTSTGQRKSEKKDPVADLEKKVEKIDLKDSKHDKEIEKALKKSEKIDPEFLEKSKKIVFKALAGLKKKRNNMISFEDISKAVEKDVPENVLREVLDIFDEEIKIQYEKKEGKIMMT